MGLLKRIFGGRDEQRLAVLTGNRQPWQYLPATVGSFTAVGSSDAGVNVTELSALTASAVYACVNIISSTLATLPLRLTDPEQSKVLRTHPVARLLCSDPNPFMTPVTFITTMMVNALLWGHGTAFIEKDEMGTPTGLYPLRSAVTRPIRLFGELLYVTQLGTEMVYLTPDRVLSVVNMTIDGITPISPIQEAKQNVGLSLALEKYAAKFFSNGGNIGGILTLPPGMTEEAIENFVASWKKNYAGADNALKVAMLPEGYKFTQTTTEPEKAQAVQSRVHQVREIARIFRVPLHKLGDLERATFSNIEQMAIEFLQDTIQPWAVRWEQECERKLLLEREKGLIEIRFDLDALLRADITARTAANVQNVNAGIKTVNEARKEMGLPPVDGGDVLRAPLNMAPVNQPTPAPEQKPDGTAARSLIEDAARRLLTKESKALTRAAKKFAGKPTELRAWAETFYAGHAGLVARVLAPSIAAAGSDTTADDYARAHCAESIRAIAAGIDAGADVQDLADEWTDIRPGEVAAQLLNK